MVPISCRPVKRRSACAIVGKNRIKCNSSSSRKARLPPIWRRLSNQALPPSRPGPGTWVVPNGVDAGQAAEATLYLEPGSYVIICGIPGKNHQSHASLGMQKALRVLDTKPAPPEFEGNFHMAMFEYEFVVVQQSEERPP